MFRVTLSKDTSLKHPKRMLYAGTSIYYPAEKGVFLMRFKIIRKLDCDVPNYVVIIVALILLVVTAFVVVKLGPSIFPWLLGN